MKKDLSSHRRTKVEAGIEESKKADKKHILIKKKKSDEELQPEFGEFPSTREEGAGEPTFTHGEPGISRRNLPNSGNYAGRIRSGIFSSGAGSWSPDKEKAPGPGVSAIEENPAVALQPELSE